MQGIADRAQAIEERLGAHEKEAERILTQIRQVAAEEGVSQQAAHFRKQADDHGAEAEKWQTRTLWLAAILAVFAGASIFIHKIPLLKPESVYETIQLTTSKVLVFSVVAYLLILAGRNFMNHKHNEIVNRHRQNALTTHRALIEGTEQSGVRDAIMMQAAACIFAPQETGYAGDHGQSGDGPGAKSVVELLTKTSSKESSS